MLSRALGPRDPPPFYCSASCGETGHTLQVDVWSVDVSRPLLS